jgi:hypothetical protein
MKTSQNRRRRMEVIANCARASHTNWSSGSPCLLAIFSSKEITKSVTFLLLSTGRFIKSKEISEYHHKDFVENYAKSINYIIC